MFGTVSVALAIHPSPEEVSSLEETDHLVVINFKSQIEEELERNDGQLPGMPKFFERITEQVQSLYKPRDLKEE